MQDYQQNFLDFSIEVDALKFGKFKLKSGRISPYFFNSGQFNSGYRLACLSSYYASAILASGVEFDMLYGPAYKGIPLVAGIAIAFSKEHQRDVPYAFNRKEAKDHGEGGTFVGAPLTGRVLIVDDVISAGLSVRESLSLIQSASAIPAGVVIALDREEKGAGSKSAVQEVQEEIGIPVTSIVGLTQLVTFLEKREDGPLEAMRTYRKQYGSPKLLSGPVL